MTLECYLALQAQSGEKVCISVSVPPRPPVCEGCAVLERDPSLGIDASCYPAGIFREKLQEDGYLDWSTKGA